MAIPSTMVLGHGRNAVHIPILYEDRAVLAIDKPAGWMLIPFSWQRTQLNLQAAITSSIAAGDFWARARNLKFLRAVHRLDGDTTGILLFVKSQGATKPLTQLFGTRAMRKQYVAIVRGKPQRMEWTCRDPLAPDPSCPGRVRVDARAGKEAETHFEVVTTRGHRALIRAWPITGRTHQIRIHLRQAGLPIVGDALYGSDRADSEDDGGEASRRGFPLGLRAVRLEYRDPFVKRTVRIDAPTYPFLEAYGFEPEIDRRVSRTTAHPR